MAMLDPGSLFAVDLHGVAEDALHFFREFDTGCAGTDGPVYQWTSIGPDGYDFLRGDVPFTLRPDLLNSWLLVVADRADMLGAFLHALHAPVPSAHFERVMSDRRTRKMAGELGVTRYAPTFGIMLSALCVHLDRRECLRVLCQHAPGVTDAQHPLVWYAYYPGHDEGPSSIGPVARHLALAIETARGACAQILVDSGIEAKSIGLEARAREMCSKPLEPGETGTAPHNTPTPRMEMLDFLLKQGLELKPHHMYEFFEAAAGVGRVALAMHLLRMVPEDARIPLRCTAARTGDMRILHAVQAGGLADYTAPSSCCEAWLSVDYGYGLFCHPRNGSQLALAWFLTCFPGTAVALGFANIGWCVYSCPRRYRACCHGATVASAMRSGNERAVEWTRAAMKGELMPPQAMEMME